MKAYKLILILVLSCPLLAQTPAPSVSELVVVRKEWRVGRLPLPADSQLAKPDPEAYQRELLEVMKENERRAQKGFPPLPPPRAPIHRPTTYSTQNLYFYEVVLKNTGERAIKTIAWDYVFYEPGTKRELGRQEFLSRTKIRQGATKKLTEKLLLPPTKIVAAGAGKKLSDQYLEEVIILAVEYDDGTIWQRGKK